MDYRPIQTIERIIAWNKLQRNYKIRKKFSSVMMHLKNKDYIHDHGKSGDVYALNDLGDFLC